MFQYEDGYLEVYMMKMTPGARWWLVYVVKMREYCQLDIASDMISLPYILPYAPWDDLKECIDNESLQYLTLYTKFYLAVTADVVYY